MQQEHEKKFEFSYLGMKYFWFIALVYIAETFTFCLKILVLGNQA